jgi:hypothetical protein
MMTGTPEIGRMRGEYGLSTMVEMPRTYETPPRSSGINLETVPGLMAGTPMVGLNRGYEAGSGLTPRPGMMAGTPGVGYSGRTGLTPRPRPIDVLPPRMEGEGSLLDRPGHSAYPFSPIPLPALSEGPSEDSSEATSPVASSPSSIEGMGGASASPIPSPLPLRTQSSNIGQPSLTEMGGQTTTRYEPMDEAPVIVYEREETLSPEYGRVDVHRPRADGSWELVHSYRGGKQQRKTKKLSKKVSKKVSKKKVSKKVSKKKRLSKRK